MLHYTSLHDLLFECTKWPVHILLTPKLCLSFRSSCGTACHHQKRNTIVRNSMRMCIYSAPFNCLFRQTFSKSHGCSLAKFSLFDLGVHRCGLLTRGLPLRVSTYRKGYAVGGCGRMCLCSSIPTESDTTYVYDALASSPAVGSKTRRS